ncbi:MAG: hypothetical protein KF884_03365 [Fimbriimonadaceae bacterium]|nr:hypothetical protein [Fimbriimonadaceae bacterium]QYK59130.1 MAG: hypothetical protein KF884_03365 [Fimbriimonadaceae bacterium]
MANNQKQFEGFLENIQLIGDDLASLRTSRDANRDRIKKHWKDTLERAVPTFEEQGSFEMGTVIRPIEGDYDLDDGMYLNCIGDDPEDWESTSTIQGWVCDAVNGATQGDPEKRKRCVRIPYKGGYHIDVPSYGVDSFNTTRVYEKGKEPTDFDESNPVALVDWFNERKQSHSDLRDLMRFFKAWRDYKKGPLAKIKSVTMTILVAERIQSNDRYDQAVVDTARHCANHIRGGGSVAKPVAPVEDLTASWTADDRTKIADAFDDLAEKGEEAIAADTIRAGALLWQGQFGPRYPVPDDGAEKAAGPSIFVKRDIRESQPFA